MENEVLECTDCTEQTVLDAPTRGMIFGLAGKVVQYAGSLQVHCDSHTCSECHLFEHITHLETASAFLG